VIGGGMPIGAMIGKSEWMDALDGGHWQFGDDSVPPGVSPTSQAPSFATR
jgi:glutamate-1-semialdehyde aminotransferase